MKLYRKAAIDTNTVYQSYDEFTENTSYTFRLVHGNSMSKHSFLEKASLQVIVDTS